MVDLFSGREGVSPREIIEIPNVVTGESGHCYEVGDRIAAGGNGVVHQCVDLSDSRDYAIKFQLDLRNVRRTRFEREKALLCGLQHDHLVGYRDSGQVDGMLRRPRQRKLAGTTIPFIVMMLATETLFEHVKRSPVPPEIFSAQFRGLARGLAELHKRAVHRDIKPDNILVMGDRWVLSDYGLCDMHTPSSDEQLTREFEIVGPRFWMSPEANNRSIGRNDGINAASDVFQLASVFWFVVNRSHPTGVLSREDWYGPERLFDPIFRALHHNAAVRPNNGQAFADQIDAAVGFRDD